MSILAIRRQRPAVALPVNTSPNYCGTCWTSPGQAHELSCPEVTPEQMSAFLRGRGFRPHRDAVRNYRGPLIGLALVAPFWVAVIAWSLA